MSVPGLKKRVRGNGTTVWYWVADGAERSAERAADVRAYPIRTVALKATTEAEAEAEAWPLTTELRAWLAERAKLIRFKGTIGSLIDCYQTDETSPYRSNIRENTRRSYDHDLGILLRHVGATRVSTLTRADFFRWHTNFAKPKEKDGERRVRRAHGLMTMVRMLLSFGKSMRFEGCAAAKEVIDEMTFEVPGARQRAMAFEQAAAVVDEAAKVGRRSIALGQALQFELGLRQIDVIGQWVVAAPGAVGIVHGGQQWTGGITWADLTAERLAKRTSKTGQAAEWNPAAYPLLVKAMALFAESERVGPAVVDETTTRPYKKRDYSGDWRAIARAAGVPDDVWNMDSRAGAITEAHEAGANPEDVRKFATHADARTTQRYVRRTSEATDRVARLRVEFRGRDGKQG